MSSSTSETENTTTNTISTLHDKLIVLNAGSKLYIKLDGDNYPAWRIQFIALLTGCDLLGYIDGSNPCPQKNLDADSTLNSHQSCFHPLGPPGSTHPSWNCFIRHSHSGHPPRHCLDCKTAWDTLKTMYAGRSRVRFMALKQKISTFSKGTQSMVAYLQGIKAISDELSIIDSPLDNTDLVIHTLNGLTIDYREVSAALRSRETPIEFAELHEKLMDFETILHREGSAQNDLIVAIAHVATRNSNKPQYKSKPSSGNTSSVPQNQKKG